MKRIFSVIALLFVAGPLLAQSTEQTQRRLRRTETRTTTTDLYKDRDTLVNMLKKRMTTLTEGASANTGAYFAEDARVTGVDGKEVSAAEYQRSLGALKYRDYRLKNLRIEENTATATETYVYAEPAGSGKQTAEKKATISSDLRKTGDGRWLITRMRVSSN